ncbi:MAG: hypothetical protein IKG39_06125 [Lachnospiraceae bacterium]|nr:hypothetical protein [Lachnospiraceae bacterium]
MDAVKFLKERERMCESFKTCDGCSFNHHCSDFMGEYAEEAVRIVEQWSNEHPIMTNLMKFKEVFGKCNTEVTAQISWWMEEYHEPKGE